MTISSTTNKVTYSGDGSTTVLPYTFRILDQGDLLVQKKQNSTGTLTTLTITTDYTVSGVDAAAGGNVTLTSASLSGYTYIITRGNMSRTQTTDYSEYDTFPAESHEKALDKLTMLGQLNQQSVDQCIKLDAGVSGFSVTIPDPTLYAGKVWKINAGGTAIEFVSAVDAGVGVIGSTLQAWSAKLDSLAALTWAADKVPYFTSASAVTTFGIASTVRTWCDTPSSANLVAAMTTKTGTGNLVFDTSPTFVTPILGTPTSGNLSNCTFPTLNQNTTGSSGSCTGNAATATSATKLRNTTDGYSCDTSGRCTNTNQPKFVATGGAGTDKTGDGTFYTLIFGTSTTNVGTCYNTATGVFTAPVAGFYAFSAVVHPSGFGVGTILECGFKINGSLTDNFYVQGSNFINGGECVLPLTYHGQLAASDTVEVVVAVFGTTKTVDFTAASQRFAGFLLG